MADSGPDQPTAYPVNAPAPSRNPLRRLYHWILSWANHPWGTVALAVFAFLDSFVFPIPPLFLQVALSLERPKRSFWYAFVDTTASVLGAVAGYWIGYALWNSVGVRIIGPIPPDVEKMLRENAFLWTLVYSFIPLPFKLITLSSGFFHLSLVTLLVASTLGRSARFFALAAICYVYGNRARNFIERHFNGVCLAIGVLIAVAIVVLKLILKR
jgi:membrane protein YqaA with SNARE-associated domain